MGGGVSLLNGPAGGVRDWVPRHEDNGSAVNASVILSAAKDLCTEHNVAARQVGP